MSTYGKIDSLILEAISRRVHPLYGREVNQEAERIAAAMGREAFRVIDGRLIALRKAGKITHHTKATGKGGCAGWSIVEQKP